MEVRVHREFIRSLSRLGTDEQKSVRRLLGMVARGEQTSGMRFHNVGNFLSISPNMDLRVLAVGPPDRLTFAYVDHHKPAYEWAERRRVYSTSEGGIELFPVLDDAALYPEKDEPVPLVLERIAERYANSDEVLTYIEGLSPEWQEWFFRRYIEKVDPQGQLPPTSSLTHCFNSDQELLLALSLEFLEWSLFLHPRQQDCLLYDGPSFAVTGGPGTGKTIVLLARLVRPTRPNRIRVLLAYSQNLVRDYRELLKFRALGDSTHARVMNLNDLVDSFVPAKQAKFRPSAQYRFELHDQRLYTLQERGTRLEVEELLIDEFQDADPLTIRHVEKLISLGVNVTIAADLGQTLFRSNADDLKSVFGQMTRVSDLTYCYRSSMQIMKSSEEARSGVLAHFKGGEPSLSSVTYALSGIAVSTIHTPDLSSQVQVCDRIIKEMETRYDQNGLAVIYLQYPNPAFKGPSKEEAALKNHPRLKRYYQFASLTKGREFLAGIVFVSSTFLAKDMGPGATQLRANTLYVAMTRFRDELFVIYPDGCPIEPALASCTASVTVPASA
jgi:hypothetical protein